jgi:hypothetical protein
MKLSACIAAKQFGRRVWKHPRRQRTPLRPLALRWRRLPRPVAARVVQPPHSASNTWFSQVHLHLGWLAAVNNRFRQFPPQAPSTAPSARSFRETLSVSRSLRPDIPGPSTGHRLPLAAGARIVFRRNVFRLFDGMPITARQAMRRRIAPTPDAPVNSIARRMRVADLAHRRGAIKVDAPVRQRPAASGLRSLAWARSTPRGRTLDAPAVVRSERVRIAKAPVELVWRAQHSVASGASDGMMVVSGSMALATPAAVSRSPVPAAASRVTSESEKARPAPLDPMLVDRLAEDVIRRVERRVRIERERRGI